MIHFIHDDRVWVIRVCNVIMAHINLRVKGCNLRVHMIYVPITRDTPQLTTAASDWSVSSIPGLWLVSSGPGPGAGDDQCQGQPLIPWSPCALTMRHHNWSHSNANCIPPSGPTFYITPFNSMLRICCCLRIFLKIALVPLVVCSVVHKQSPRSFSAIFGSDRSPRRGNVVCASIPFLK